MTCGPLQVSFTCNLFQMIRYILHYPHFHPCRRDRVPGLHGRNSTRESVSFWCTQPFPAIVFTNTFNASFDKVCHNVVHVNERNDTTDIRCQEELQEIITLSSKVYNTTSTIEYISALCEIIAPLPHPKVSIPLRLKARLSDKPGQAHKHTKVSMTS